MEKLLTSIVSQISILLRKMNLVKEFKYIIANEIETIAKESEYKLFNSTIKHIIGFCEAASKNLEMNYSSLKSFIVNKDIDEVVVMGHSIMGVDLPYYSNVIVPILKDCRWIFWHSKDNQDEINLFIKQFSLKNFVLIEW